VMQPASYDELQEAKHEKGAVSLHDEAGRAMLMEG
jgi:hypothetical protein